MDYQDNDILRYKFLYSPRTNYNNKIENEQKLYEDLVRAFDPYSIKFLKKHFKEHLGFLNKETFICIIKRHLLSWKPDLPNREKIIIKLLSRLFNEIDINSNNEIEWKDFVNYIISISNISTNKKSLYALQSYNQSKTVINHQYPNDNNSKFKNMSPDSNIVSYCFYIEKYKLVGIVHEGKSKIMFYDAEKRKMDILEIDLMDTQKEINECEMMEINLKAAKLIKKEEEEEKERKLNAIKFNNKIRFSNKNENERIPTPESIKREITKINNSNNTYQNDIKNRKEFKFYPIYACFADDYDILFISSNNNKISAWRYNNKKNEFKNVNSLKMKDFSVEEGKLAIPLYNCELPQYAMCFDNVLKVLYSGQEDGKIFQWDLTLPKPVHTFEINNDKKINFSTINKNNSQRKVINLLSLPKIERSLLISEKKEKKEEDLKEEKTINYPSTNQEQNKNTVSCLLLISNLRLLCSTYFSGQVILWDIIRKRPKKIYNDQKTIVYQVVYNPYKNRIYTCGFEHEIFVYDPYNEDNAVQKLKGHMASISSISFNKENNELISIDIQGNMKIWDANDSVNFQSINIRESLTDESNNNKQKKKMNTKLNLNVHVEVLSDIKQIIVYGENNLILFEKGKTTNPLLCDDSIIIGCIFNSYNNEIISISTQRIKFWNILNGKVNKMYEDLMNGSDISVFELDKRNKKIYLGDNYGKIRCYSLINGILLKVFKSHTSGIVNIFHSMKYKMLITCSFDLCIRFHSGIDDNIDIYKEVMVLNNSGNNSNEKKFLKKIVFNEDDKLLIMALSNGTITYYDFNYNKFINDNNEQNSLKRAYNISCLIDLPNIKCLFISYEKGENYLVAKLNNKYYHFLSGQKFGNFIENEKEEKNGKNEKNDYNKKNIIYSCVYDDSSYRLLLGDHAGFVSCFDLTILKEIMEKEFASKEEILLYIKNNLNIRCIFTIQPYKQSITYLTIPLNLNPKLFITIGSDSIVKLFDFEKGEYIESLKQISIKYTSVPVAITFIRENPFGDKINIKKDEEEFVYMDEDAKKRKEEILQTIQTINKNYRHYLMINEELDNRNNKLIDDEGKECIIYRCEIEHNLKIPEINYANASRSDIINYSNKLLEYNAKVKLQSQIMGQKIMPSKSSPWNFDVDYDSIIRKEKEDLQRLYAKIREKEKEVIESENNFQHISIISNSYIPNFLNNLKNKDKIKFNENIKDKLRIIDLSNAKKNVLREEENEIKKYIQRHRYPHNLLSIEREKLKKDDKKKENKASLDNKILLNKKDFITPELKSLNTIETTNGRNNRRIIINKSLNSLQADFHDLRFLECKNQFDEKYNEISNPLKLILKKYPKKKRLLPKLSQNI